MWEYFKELVAGAIAIAGIGWIMAHLVLIQIHGKVWIHEPNSAILWAELVITGLILALLGERLYKDIKKRRGK